MGIELLIADEESLGKLNKSFKTIRQIIYSVDYFLISFDLGLSFYDFLVDLDAYSAIYSLEFEIDVLLDYFTVIDVLILLLLQLQNLQGDSFPKRVHFIIAISQIKFSFYLYCFFDSDDFVPDISMWAKLDALLANYILAGIAIIG